MNTKNGLSFGWEMFKHKQPPLVRKHWIFLCLWALFVLGCQKIHIGMSIQGNPLSFTCSAILLPLIGNFIPFPLSALFLSIMWIFTHFSAVVPLTMGIPTFFATLSWDASNSPKSIKHFLLHVLLPALCMTLFCLSPVGAQAWLYSCFWLIPITLYFLPVKSIIQRALMSTFVAHAIGSVIWVYCVPMSSQQWLHLIPVVALERLVIALISTCMLALLQQGSEMGAKTLAKLKLS